MKKLVFLLILSILTAVLSTSISGYKRAYATASGFLRVIDSSTPFYSSPTSSNPLFYLPYTYYVKILGNENGFIHVECFVSNFTPSIDGYVPEGMLFDDGLMVVNPYVNVDIKTVHTAVLYADSTLTTPVQYIFPDRNMRYYGALPTASGMLYYVEYNDRLGFVKETDVYPFVIANHPNELTFILPEEPLPNETPDNIEQGTEEELVSLKVIIIACLVFAGVISLFIALKQHPRRSVAVSYYDDNDYE